MFGESNCLKLGFVSETLSRVVSTKKTNNIGKASPESKQESCKSKFTSGCTSHKSRLGFIFLGGKKKKEAKQEKEQNPRARAITTKV
jgi:hypothetical protein